MKLEKAVMECFHSFVSHYEAMRCIRSKGCTIRMPNFPEFVSESLVHYYIQNIEQNECSGMCTGDLVKRVEDRTLKVEVKCFSSRGPSSFGPARVWDELYFVDARKFLENDFKIYHIQLSNDNPIFSGVMVNKKETYLQQCNQQRRPRIAFDKIMEQIPNHISCVYMGKIE